MLYNLIPAKLQDPIVFFKMKFGGKLLQTEKELRDWFKSY